MSAATNVSVTSSLTAAAASVTADPTDMSAATIVSVTPTHTAAAINASVIANPTRMSAATGASTSGITRNSTPSRPPSTFVSSMYTYNLQITSYQTVWLPFV